MFFQPPSYSYAPVVYRTPAEFRAPDEPEVIITLAGRLCINGYEYGKPLPDPFGSYSALRPAGTSRGLSGEHIERFIEISTGVTLRHVTRNGHDWWDVDQAGGEA